MTTRKTAKRKPGAGRKRDLLVKRVPFRVTESEYAQIATDATANGRSIPQQVRWIYFQNNATATTQR